MSLFWYSNLLLSFDFDELRHRMSKKQCNSRGFTCDNDGINQCHNHWTIITNMDDEVDQSSNILTSTTNQGCSISVCGRDSNVTIRY